MSLPRAFSAATIIAIAFVLAFAGQGHAASCLDTKKQPTHIRINLLLPDPVYDLSQSVAEINRGARERHQAWLEKNGMKSIWSASDMRTLGQAAGGWAGKFGYTIQPAKYDVYATYYCNHFRALEIEIIYRTIIMIPKEIPQDNCAFSAIRTHELRHHEANVAAMRKYTRQLETDINSILAYLEQPVLPYQGKEKMPERLQQMKQGVESAVDVYYLDFVQREMEKLNHAIDSPAEYESQTLMIGECLRDAGLNPASLFR